MYRFWGGGKLSFGLPKWLSGKKNPPAKQEAQEMPVQSLGWEDPLKEEMATHSVFLPGESHGQRNMVGCSLWSHRRIRHDLATKQH